MIACVIRTVVPANLAQPMVYMCVWGGGPEVTLGLSLEGWVGGKASLLVLPRV